MKNNSLALTSLFEAEALIFTLITKKYIIIKIFKLLFVWHKQFDFTTNEIPIRADPPSVFSFVLRSQTHAEL